MRGDTAQGVIEFVMEECCNCGIPFYMTKDLKKRRLEDGKWFYCPQGHGQHYTETTVSKLQKQLETAKRDAKFWQEREADECRQRALKERQLASVRGHLTRAKNQLQKGNCPNCDEHFDDLEQHIISKHPDFELELTTVPEPETPKRRRGRPPKVKTELAATRSTEKVKA